MRQISCLIVDDEPPFVQRLSGFFEKWRGQGTPFVLAGATCSSREALRLGLELKPDIVITDMVMPELNGIELVRMLKEALPGTEFIILSAYSEFNYAKQAIEINVSDYLVKIPLKEADVYAALEKARSVVLQREEKERKYHNLSYIVKDNLHRIRKQLVEELVRGDIQPRTMEQRAGELLTSFQPANYCCLTVRIDEEEQFRSMYGREDQKKLKYGMLNIIEEVLSQAGDGFACELEPNLFTAFVALKEKSTSALEQRMYETGLDMQVNIKKYLRQFVSVGSSQVHAGWDAAGRAYRQALLALGDSFYTGCGSVITQTRRFHYDEEEAGQFRKSVRRIADGLTPLQAEASRRELEQLMRSFRGKVPPAALLEALREFITDMDRKLPGTTGLSAEPTAYIAGLLHWEQALAALDASWQRAFVLLEESDIHPEIRKAVAFIAENVAEPLSLGLVAEHIKMNANYVSELFKKELGENFTDYVNRLRVEKAIQLLNSSRDYSNLELAQSVGIQTEKYFCTLFKKYTGTSPQKYVKPRILK
ncbi:MAG: hypothetical protein K0R57_5540 [Paenibacillaceae bacterium]|jgi:two-component system response regulator YesN|nr:hypothetical protein [Paenibacillaceae bacterium]